MTYTLFCIHTMIKGSCGLIGYKSIIIMVKLGFLSWGKIFKRWKNNIIGMNVLNDLAFFFSHWDKEEKQPKKTYQQSTLHIYE